jgi:glutamine amidotransferase
MFKRPRLGDENVSVTAVHPRPVVGIVDYGMGNLRSVANAFSTLDCTVHVVAVPAELDSSTHIVLPGVGAFGDGMAALRARGWVDVLSHMVHEEATPLLGICLGMQLLASVGSENGTHAGLGWVPGAVDRLPGEGVRVPHVGWNDVDITRPCRLFQELGERPAFYFVHSFAMRPEADDVVTGTCDHGRAFVATLHDRNVHGVQFHPEKSHRTGLQMLRNFLSIELDAPC